MKVNLRSSLFLRSINEGRKVEHRKVDDILQKISRDVVNRAKDLGVTIVFDYPKGMREKE